MDIQPNHLRYTSKYHVNNCRKWAERISRDHTLQFAGKKGTTASMGSEASGNGPGERTFPLTRRNFLTYRGKITSEKRR